MEPEPASSNGKVAASLWSATLGQAAGRAGVKSAAHLHELAKFAQCNNAECCFVCKEGGELVPCDWAADGAACPFVYHSACIGGATRCPRHVCASTGLEQAAGVAWVHCAGCPTGIVESSNGIPFILRNGRPYCLACFEKVKVIGSLNATEAGVLALQAAAAGPPEGAAADDFALAPAVPLSEAEVALGKGWKRCTACDKVTPPPAGRVCPSCGASLAKPAAAPSTAKPRPPKAEGGPQTGRVRKAAPKARESYALDSDDYADAGECPDEGGLYTPGGGRSGPVKRRKAAAGAAAGERERRHHPTNCQCPECVARRGPVAPDLAYPLFGCPKCRHLPEGCSACRGGPSVKKSATHRPAAARRPQITGEAPVYHPTEEEFLDPLAYIAKIRPEAERFGLCRIVPPPSFRPPFVHAAKAAVLRFATRIQGGGTAAAKGVPGSEAAPTVVESVASPPHVECPRCQATLKPPPGAPRFKCGQCGAVLAAPSAPPAPPAPSSPPAPPVAAAPTQPPAPAPIPIDTVPAPGRTPAPTLTPTPAPSAPARGYGYGFRAGLVHTLVSLERYTRYFRSRYFKGVPGGQPGWETAEGEFWRVVESGRGGVAGTGAPHCEVIYGADIDSGVVGSGFPGFPAGWSEIPPSTELPPCTADLLRRRKPGVKAAAAAAEASAAAAIAAEAAAAARAAAAAAETGVGDVASGVTGGEATAAVHREPGLEYPWEAMARAAAAAASESGVALQPDAAYADCLWNVCRMPRHPVSCLRKEAAVTGITVPWLYFGMAMSAFCWHCEDFWFYSVNYHHWGERKVWYGVPSAHALQFEEAFQRHLPELFKAQPDLLYHLTTTLSPGILAAEGIPVYRAVQEAGNFIITFPRAYHAGFNVGFNCAEAVNFAPPDWLPFGAAAVERYRRDRRTPSVAYDAMIMGLAETLLALPTAAASESGAVLPPESRRLVARYLAPALAARLAEERAAREKVCGLLAGGVDAPAGGGATWEEVHIPGAEVYGDPLCGVCSSDAWMAVLEERPSRPAAAADVGAASAGGPESEPAPRRLCLLCAGEEATARAAAAVAAAASAAASADSATEDDDPPHPSLCGPNAPFAVGRRRLVVRTLLPDLEAVAAQVAAQVTAAD